MADAREKQRTLAQNRALHLYCTNLAHELNDHGLDMRTVLKPTIDIPWSGETVKEFIFKRIMKAQLLKESTTELTTTEVDLVINTITRHMGEKFGITVDFPSVETIINDSLARQNEKR